MEHLGNYESQHSDGLLIILTGPTAVGKDETWKKLREVRPGLKRVITSTTREARTGEVDGVDYHFVSAQGFSKLKKQGQFIETKDLVNYSYGTSKDELLPVLGGEDRVWVIDMDRAATIEEVFQKELDSDTAEALFAHTLVIVIGAPSLFTLRDRFRKRAKAPFDNRLINDNFLSRVHVDWEHWQKHKDTFANVVVNETNHVAKTAQEVLAFVDRKRAEP